MNNGHHDFARDVLTGAVRVAPGRGRRFHYAAVAVVLCFLAGFLAGYMVGFSAGVSTRVTWEARTLPPEPEPRHYTRPMDERRI